jgi:hypothetical protein
VYSMLGYFPAGDYIGSLLPRQMPTESPARDPAAGLVRQQR